MLKKMSFVLLTVMVIASSGRADVVFATGTETVNQSVFAGSPSYSMVNRMTGTTLGGYEFANDITSTTPTVGDFVNIVVVDKVTGYVQTGGGSPSSSFPVTVTLVGAIQAQITSTPAGAINTTFLSGLFGIFFDFDIQHLAPQHMGRDKCRWHVIHNPHRALLTRHPGQCNSRNGPIGNLPCRHA